MNVLTDTELADALQERLGWPQDECEAHADYLLDMFGFQDRIIDNILESDDRQLFYNLESRGLLTTRSEENQLHNGSTWRTHYWVLRMDKIHEAATTLRAQAKQAEQQEQDLYMELPDDVWARAS